MAIARRRRRLAWAVVDPVEIRSTGETIVRRRGLALAIGRFVLAEKPTAIVAVRGLGAIARAIAKRRRVPVVIAPRALLGAAAARDLYPEFPIFAPSPLFRSRRASPSRRYSLVTLLPATMLVATAPLFAPEPERSGAVETLAALMRARLAFRDDLLAFGAPLGFTEALLRTWIGTGLVQCGTSVIDAARGTTAEVLAPTPKGARELGATTGQAWKGLSSSRFRRSGRKLAHDATVGQVALAVMAAARTESLDVRGVETDDHVLAQSAFVSDERGHPTRVPLQADAYVLTHDGQTLRGLLVEVDRGTTAATRLADKFRGYAEWSHQSGPERAFGIKAMRVVTVVPDERRLERLRQVALAAVGRPSAMFLFALASDVTPREPERLLGPIAMTLARTTEPLFRRA